MLRVFSRCQPKVLTCGVIVVAAFRRSRFGVAFEPLRKALPDNLHLLTLKARDAVTDDVVMRLHNLGGDTSAELPTSAFDSTVASSQPRFCQHSAQWSKGH